MQKELIEKACEQLAECLLRISTFAVTEHYIDRDYHLLKLELQHFDSLLELLRSNISIKEYVSKYKMLISNEEFYEEPRVYRSFSSLEKAQFDVDRIYLEEELTCFVNVLKICSENLKKHINAKQYEKIKDEIYYNHNVPWLICTKNKGAIKYYLSIECPECIRRCSKEMVQCYEEVWAEVRKQFPEQNETNEANSRSSKKQGLFRKLFKR